MTLSDWALVSLRSKSFEKGCQCYVVSCAERFYKCFDPYPTDSFVLDSARIQDLGKIRKVGKVLKVYCFE